MEAQNFLKAGRLVKQSEQNLADCANADFSSYCEIGSPECAFYYVYKNGGIDTEKGYPKMHVSMGSIMFWQSMNKIIRLAEHMAFC